MHAMVAKQDETDAGYKRRQGMHGFDVGEKD